MYRTDKQFMKNPATASQRVYVGGLQNTVVADDLEQKFRQHGKILGLVLQRGFAFVQFETDQEAQAAIRAEQGSILHGKKIVVKHAMRGNNMNNNMNQNMQNKPPEQHNMQWPPPPLMQNNPPKQVEPYQEPPKPKPNQEPPKPKPHQEPPKPKPNQEPPKPKPTQEPPKPKPVVIEEPCQSPPEIKEEELEMIAEKFQEVDEQQDFQSTKALSIVSSENYDDEDSRGPVKKRPGRGRNKPRNEDRYPHPPSNERDRYRGQGQFYPQPERFPEYPQPAPMIMERPERNDCEIIVVSKLLTEYAEYIESRLKALGLIVDLLFPNEDVPIGRVLANISSRGCLYAILVMPQNKENQSLTLNVLHGIPQEHRNMPLDDALLYITRNFDSYMRGENIPNAETSTKMTVFDKHPNAMQLMLNMIAENRALTSIQYDKVLRYLEERRELQVQFEISEGIEVSHENVVNKQAELQNRIMTILNKSSDNNGSAEPEQATPPPAPSVPGPTPLLKDPTVQKALDSLLLGDMFKNIAG